MYRISSFYELFTSSTATLGSLFYLVLTPQKKELGVFRVVSFPFSPFFFLPLFCFIILFPFPFETRFFEGKGDWSGVRYGIPGNEHTPVLLSPGRPQKVRRKKKENVLDGSDWI